MLAVALYIYPVDIKIEMENWRVALFLKWRLSPPTVLWSPYVTELKFRWFFKYLFQMQGSRWTLAAVLKLKCVGILLSHWTKYSWTSVFHWTSRIPSPVRLRIETWYTQGAWLALPWWNMSAFRYFHAKVFHSSSVRSYTQNQLDRIWLQQTICRSWMTNFWLFAWEKRHLIFCLFAGTSSTDHVLCGFVQLQSPFNLCDLLLYVHFHRSSSSFPNLENTFVQAG